MTLLISSFICVLANYSFVTIGVLLPLQLRTLVHTITECLPSSTLDTPTCKQVYELLKKQVERGRSAALSTQRWLALFTSVPETTTTFELTTDGLLHLEASLQQMHRLPQAWYDRNVRDRTVVVMLLLDRLLSDANTTSASCQSTVLRCILLCRHLILKLVQAFPALNDALVS
jgi:hypothetical protein